MVESVASLEFFFKECALKLLEDKRPNFKLMIALFKALAKVFEYGTDLNKIREDFDRAVHKLRLRVQQEQHRGADFV